MTNTSASLGGPDLANTAPYRHRSRRDVASSVIWMPHLAPLSLIALALSIIAARSEHMGIAGASGCRGTPLPLARRQTGQPCATTGACHFLARPILSHAIECVIILDSMDPSDYRGRTTYIGTDVDCFPARTPNADRLTGQ